ncbi:MAG: hypothetical protein HYZ44_02810 [Bacteroidetes bacterium]|nr:hypothetical protein [Bacteroidota bacterium]
MKNLLFKSLILISLTQNTFGQFNKFYDSHGFILSQGASISSHAYATVGGGVVLKGIAKPKYTDSLFVFTNISFGDTKGISTIFFQTPNSNISFSDSSWLMRDAAMLVKSENKNAMYRDVNLFGNFTDKEYERRLDKKYPPDLFFNVEMADSLRNTKSGETLLLMDIMLASADNTTYYSKNKQATKKYKLVKDSLQRVIYVYNDSVKFLRLKSINEIYLKLKTINSQRQHEKLDSNEFLFLHKITNYSLYYLFKSKLGYDFPSYDDSARNYSKESDSLFAVNYTERLLWSDYTYNDENTNYKFYFDKNDRKLKIDGEPNYTFLHRKQSFYYPDKFDIDSLFTNYYINNKDLIKNLNISVVTNAQHFGKIASFFRYLKNEYPKLWIRVYSYYSRTKKAKGQTPRFINMYPIN